MKKDSKLRPIISALLCCVMVIGLLPLQALAEENTEAESTSLAEKVEAKNEPGTVDIVPGANEPAGDTSVKEKSSSIDSDAVITKESEEDSEDTQDDPADSKEQSNAEGSSVSKGISGFSIRRIIVQPEEYIVTYNFYDADGATLLSSQDVKNGDTLLKPETPEKSGKIFAGWYRKDESGNYADEFSAFGGVSGITEDGTVNLYAKYTDAVCIFYYDQYNNIIKSEEVEPNSTVTIYNDAPVIQVEPLTQCQDGWSLVQNGTEDVSGEFVLGTEAVKLYPILKNGYWVTFESNGGSSVASQFIAFNAAETERKATMPDPVPVKQGYLFDKWYTDAELTQEYDFSQDVTNPLTLYAGYTPTDTEYTVRYYIEYQVEDGEAGTVGEGTWDYKFFAYQIKTGKTGEQAEYEENYIFEVPYNRLRTEYELNEEKTVAPTIAADGSTVYNVYYKCKAYRLEIAVPLNDGTTQTLSYPSVKYTARLANFWDEVFKIRPEEELFDGSHRFVDPRSGGGSGDNFVQSASVLPRMSDEDYTMTYQAMGTDNSFYYFYKETLHGQAPDGIEVVTNQSDRKEGDTRTYYLARSNSFYSQAYGYTMVSPSTYRGFTPLPQYSDGIYLINPAGDGRVAVYYRYPYPAGLAIGLNYVFDADGNPVYYNGSENPIHIYFMRNSYNLTFHTNGGTELEPQSVLYEDDLSQYEPSSYVVGTTKKTVGDQEFWFDGWYSDSGLTALFDFNSTMPPYDVDLYAKWKPRTYSVTFDTGAGSKIPTQSGLDYGMTVTKPEDPTYEGHIFLGWTLNGRPYSFESGITNDITLVAQWQSLNVYRVKYELNGGKGAAPTDDKTYYENAGVPVASAEHITAPDGKVFIGWKSDVDDEIYYPNSTAPIGCKDMTLTAQWGDVPKTTLITYDFNFATFGITGEKEYEKTVSALKNNSRITLASIESLTSAPDGWTFDGWYLDKDCKDGPYTKVLVDTTDDLTANRVYAKWKKDANYKEVSGNDDILDKVPKTGDTTILALTGVMLFTLCGGIVVCVWNRKKNRV